MNDAEQFLADLEAKAKAATLEEWREGVAILPDGSIVGAVVTADGDEICNTGQSLLHDVANAAYIAAANPAAVLRLVGMVREYDAEATRYKKALEWALINRLYIYPDCGGSKCFRKKGENCTLSYVECMTRRILEDSASGERPMMNAARGAVKLLREVEQTAKS